MLAESQLAFCFKAERLSASPCTLSMQPIAKLSYAERAESVPAGADFKTRWLGAQHNAYPPVIAGGSDATTIHYARKDKVRVMLATKLHIAVRSTASPPPHASLRLCRAVASSQTRLSSTPTPAAFSAF